MTGTLSGNLGRMSLRESWDANAEAWIGWARGEAGGVHTDHFFWRFGLPETLALLPEPGRLTLDLGCGEGRLSRVLADRPPPSPVGLRPRARARRPADRGDP
jgi:hypothetical protein